MALELIRESVGINQISGDDTAQTIVENDIIVPDSKPDIARVLLLDGDVFVDSAEAMQDKIAVNGSIAYKILYISDEQTQSVRSINTTSNFSYVLDVSGSSSGMKCRAKCEAEHFEYNILNGRKINVKTIMSISGKATEERELEVVNNVEGVENIQLLKENIKVNSYIGDSTVSFKANENMEVPAGKPPISELLRTDVKITGKDYKITENRAIAKGDLNISTLYIADDEERSIQFMEHEIPFTQFVDMDGVDDNSSCDIEYKVTATQFEPAEDSDGELRVINGEVSIDLDVTGYTRKEIEVVADAYSPMARISIEKEPFRLEEVAVESKNQIVIKDTLSIQEGSPEISQVFNVLCKPILSEYKVFDEKISIEGVLNNNVLYLAGDSENPITCHRQEVPFKQAIDVRNIKPEMECEINLDVEHCNYSMVSSTEVEVRLVVIANIKAVNRVVVPLIVKANDSELDLARLASKPSITMYFSQPGDNLWKIAKRYYTTVDDIKSLNQLTDRDEIAVGQQIIIPRRKI